MKKSGFVWMLIGVAVFQSMAHASVNDRYCGELFSESPSHYVPTQYFIRVTNRTLDTGKEFVLDHPTGMAIRLGTSLHGNKLTSEDSQIYSLQESMLDFLVHHEGKSFCAVGELVNERTPDPQVTQSIDFSQIYEGTQ